MTKSAYLFTVMAEILLGYLTENVCVIEYQHDAFMLPMI